MIGTSKWIMISSCPLCSSKDAKVCGSLAGNFYKVGDEKVSYPDHGIGVFECSTCTLIYKYIVPSPIFLKDVFERQKGNIWGDSYNFKEENISISKLYQNKRKFDILDIGPSNGEFLKSCNNYGGRKSGLDVVKHPGVDAYIHGEFINGLLDENAIEWSGDPYDLITAFDVMEHCYNPIRSFQNMRLMIKSGGHLIIETGNVLSYYPFHYGSGNWWYAQLFEHHIFWSLNSLKAAAHASGFRLISCTEKTHKNNAKLSLFQRCRSLTKEVLYWSSPTTYRLVAKQSGSNHTQPASSIVKDHIQVIFEAI